MKQALEIDSAVETAENANWWTSWCKDQPQDTRSRILAQAFKEVHLNGFQAASIQNIIDGAGVTKGALYHHFSSKEDIGFALLDEIFTHYIRVSFIDPISRTDDPITALRDHLQETGECMSEEDIMLGCPLDHFAQEMSPLNQEFQSRIDTLYKIKHDALVDSFKKGQEAGNVTTAVAAESIALMIDATLQGCMAMAKSKRSLSTLMQCGEGLFHYLEQLRPDNQK